MTEMNQQPAQHHDGAESPVWIWILLSSIVILLVIGIVMNHDGKNTPTWTKLLGVLATLGIFSILYKENPVFRFLEHIFIGLATGYGVAFIWTNYLFPRWFIPMMPTSIIHKTDAHEAGGGQWWMFFAFLLGMLFFTVYFPKIAWMNRFIFGVMMGFFAGAAFQGFMGLIAPQITASFRPPATVGYTPTGAAELNNIPVGGHIFVHLWWLIAVIVLLCTVAYFFFSIEHRSGWIRKPAVAGRYFLMISLGAIFGTTVMGRFSLLIARLDFLRDAFVGWLHFGPK